jgi:hypothetical protein
LIFLCILCVVFNRLEQYDGHIAVHLAWKLIIDGVFDSIPASAVHKQAIYVHTIFWMMIDLVVVILQYLEGEVEHIYGYLVLSRVCLEDTRHEALREEETGDPETVRLPMLQPVIHEIDSL